MTTGQTIVLVASAEPIPGELGRGWRAIDGEPAYRRVLLLEPGTEAPDPAVFGPSAHVWVGTQVDCLEPAGDPADAGVLLVVGQEPEPGFEEPFNAWMDDEHVPGLAAVPGTMSGHRYHSPDGEPAFFALYHLRDLTVNSSPEWKRSSATPRSEEMKPHSRKRIRGLYVPEDQPPAGRACCANEV